MQITSLINEIWLASGVMNFEYPQLLMVALSIFILVLAFKKKIAPLFLVPIGFGCLLANIPLANLADTDGLLGLVYLFGIQTGLFPLLLLIALGAMLDFGPLLSDPKVVFISFAAQVSIFAVFGTALFLVNYFGFDFSLADVSAISILGAFDGITAIFLASRLGTEFISIIALFIYLYLGLLPIVQPVLIKLFTKETERTLEMKQLRHAGKLERILFPILIFLLGVFLLPQTAPLLGALMFGNFLRECGKTTERLASAVQRELYYVVVVLLGLGLGAKLQAELFLTKEALAILVLGLGAIVLGTFVGIVIVRIINLFTKNRINPIMGAAGFAPFPVSAQIVNRVGLKNNPHNFLFMHAVGPNAAAILSSILISGIFLTLMR
ncbi:sodium ion-translocating decarboxylase subunit beta [Candidatus Margulisiibacteriota bacterium]